MVRGGGDDDGCRVVVARCEGEPVAYDALCPHALGPLDAGELAAGRVTCPWHAYAFDVRSRRGCGDAQRLAPAPRVVQAGANVWLRAHRRRDPRANPTSRSARAV